MLGRDGKENPIQDATFKDGEVSFKVVRERQGQKMTSTYTGKVSRDTCSPSASLGRRLSFERCPREKGIPLSRPKGARRQSCGDTYTVAFFETVAREWGRSFWGTVFQADFA
jgi:hypothetical protein